VIKLMLDSGAYSCWRKKEALDLWDYCDYLDDNRENFEWCVNLDVIPGEFGHVPSSEQIDVAAKKSDLNYRALVREGHNPLPVFHQGERWYWLDKMIDSGAEYIGISPGNDRTTSQKREWLDEVFYRITTPDGDPIVKTHGFGMTAIPLVVRYPWFSVDSLTWMLLGGLGKIPIPPTLADGSYDFTKSPVLVNVSDRGAEKPTTGGSSDHIDHMPHASVEKVLRYLDEQGFDRSELRESYNHRYATGARYFSLFNKWYNKPTRFRSPGALFTPRAPREWATDFNFEFIFGTNNGPEGHKILNCEKEYAHHRLISYYYTRSGKIDLGEYIKTGLLPPSKKKKGKPSCNVTIS